jgi:hypothetical protein
MKTASIISIVTSFLLFGGIIAFVTLMIGKRFWNTFTADDLLGLDPNRADLLFANGSALAVKGFPWVLLIAMVAAVVLYISDHHLLAAIAAWLPLLNFLVPALLFLYKIAASR